MFKSFFEKKFYKTKIIVKNTKGRKIMKKLFLFLVILVFGSGIIIAKEIFSGKVPENIVFVGDSIMNSSKKYIGP